MENLSDPTRGGSGQAKYPEKPAANDNPINDLARRRWSPRVFDDRPVEPHKIASLLEAARWAPSSFNEQPWRYLVFDGSDPDALQRARACLIEFNLWATKAPVLMLSVAYENFSRNGAPNRHAQHDVGLASGSIILESIHQGLAIHQMAGFDAARARREFGIPDKCTPMAMMAIGYPFSGSLEAVPAMIRSMEMQKRERKAIREIAFSGKWGVGYGDK